MKVPVRTDFSSRSFLRAAVVWSMGGGLMLGGEDSMPKSEVQDVFPKIFHRGAKIAEMDWNGFLWGLWIVWGGFAGVETRGWGRGDKRLWDNLASVDVSLLAKAVVFG